jgi:hypothetical protein
MRFLLLNHHIRRSAVATNRAAAAAATGGKHAAAKADTNNTNIIMSTTKKKKSMISKSKSTTTMTTSIVSSNNNTIKSWGQQCSPNCGCVLRFETTIDDNNKNEQRVIDCRYIAKSVVTTTITTTSSSTTVGSNNDNQQQKQLVPVYTNTRKQRPMLQECKCQSLHKLAQQVTSFLINKKMNDIKSMNDSFTSSIRSTIAFRHSVLVDNNLSRNDTHCFDIVEEAYNGMMNQKIPSKRRYNHDDNFHNVLTAEYSLQQGRRPQFVNSKYVEEEDHYHNQNHHQHNMNTQHQLQQQQHHNHNRRRSTTREGFNSNMIGGDNNHTSISTPKNLLSTRLRMFDINAVNNCSWWVDNHDYYAEQQQGYHYSYYNERERDNNNDNEIITTRRHKQFNDWVSYVDELYQIEDASA